jgi:ribosome recycling factor
MNLDSVKQNMQKVVDVIKVDLGTVRTGRAAPSLVENVVIHAYGGTQNLKVIELAQIAAQDSQTLVITPYDSSIIGEISKGLLEGNVGLTPIIDGTIIRISIPTLTEERRQQLVGLVNQKLEGGKVQVRQVRHEAMEDVKKQLNNKEISEDDLFRLEKDIQRVTDETIGELEFLGKKKEEELMAI